MLAGNHGITEMHFKTTTVKELERDVAQWHENTQMDYPLDGIEVSWGNTENR